MSRRSAMILLAVMFMLAATCSAHAKDITGYVALNSNWVLGSPVTDEMLDGFMEAPVECAYTTYVDMARKIQFDGEDVTCGVMLFVLDEKLAGIFIAVPSKERTYSFVRNYYSERYMDAICLSNTTDSVIWLDRDFDSLIVRYCPNDQDNGYAEQQSNDVEESNAEDTRDEESDGQCEIDPEANKNDIHSLLSAYNNPFTSIQYSTEALFDLSSGYKISDAEKELLLTTQQ